MKDALHWPAQHPPDLTLSGHSYNYGRWPGNEGCPLLRPDVLRKAHDRASRKEYMRWKRQQKRDPLGLEE